MRKKPITVIASSATSCEDLANIALATFECPTCSHLTTANANSDPCCHYCGNIKAMAKVMEDVVEAHVHENDDSDELARIVCASCSSPNIVPVEHVARLEDSSMHCVVCSVPMTLEVAAEDMEEEDEEDMSGDDVEDDVEEAGMDEDEDEDEMDDDEVEVEESSFEETAAGAKKGARIGKDKKSKRPSLAVDQDRMRSVFKAMKADPSVKKAITKKFPDVDYTSIKTPTDAFREFQIWGDENDMSIEDIAKKLYTKFVPKDMQTVESSTEEEAGAFGAGYNKGTEVEDYYDGEGNKQSTQDPVDPPVDRVDQFKTEDGVDHSTQDPMDMMEMSTATLFDVLASTDIDREVEFVRVPNRVLCLVDDTHVATLRQTEEMANADLFETEAYVHALEASVTDQGLKETLDSYQFELSAIQLDHEVLSSYVNKKLGATHSDEVASVKHDYQDNYKQSLEIAATGLNRGMFTDHAHVLKERLVSDLTTAGVRNSQHLVDVAFAETEDQHIANLMELAGNLVNKNVDYRNDLAEGLTKMNSPITAKVVEESSALEHKLTTPFTVESSVTPNTATRGVGGTVKSILAKNRARRAG